MNTAASADCCQENVTSRLAIKIKSHHDEKNPLDKPKPVLPFQPMSVTDFLQAFYFLMVR